MIGFLRGNPVYIGKDYCLLDVGGVGYRVYADARTLQTMHIGSETMVYTYLSVREDALTRYGFSEQQSYELFLELISVSGIGPKVAMGIISSITAERFARAIQGKEIKVLTKLPGIGKKSAERMVLELKDKVGWVRSDDDAPDNEFVPIEDSVASEAVQALISLGYSEDEIMPVMKDISSKYDKVEDLIKNTLKEFARR